MKRIIIPALFILVSFKSFSQSPTINLQKYFGGSGSDYGQFLQKTNDGNFIIIGSVRSGDGNIIGYHGGTDIWVAKVSPSGSLLWQRTLGGSSNDIAVGYTYNNADGSIAVIANTESTDGDITIPRGMVDVWVFRLNNLGTLDWQKTLGGSSDDRALNIISTSDGNYLFTAETHSANFDVTGNHGNADIWLVKLTTTGNIVWQRCYGGSGEDGEDDYGTSLMETIPGTYLFSANTSSSDGDVSGFSGGNNDAWVVATNSLGTIAWQTCIGGSGNDVIRKLKIAPNGNIVTLIQTSSPEMRGYHTGAGGAANNFDILKCRLNNTGTILSRQCYGSSLNEYPVDLVIINDSIDVIAGKIQRDGADISGSHDNDEFSKDLWFCKTKRDTTIVWQKAFGGSKDEQPSEWLGNAVTGVISGINNMKLLAGNDIMFSCISRSNDGDVKRYHPYGSFFDYDIWLFTIDSLGVIKAQQNIGGGSNEWVGSSVVSAAATGSSYYAIASSESYNNNQPSSGKLSDILLLQFSGDDYVTGKVYYDNNNNNIQDAGEPLVNNASLKFQKTNYLQNTISNKGLYLQALDTGKYVITCNAPNPYFIVAPAIVNDTFNLYFRTDTIDFALQPIPLKRDAGIVVAQLNEVRPDTTVSYQINYFNQGTDTIPSGTVIFKKDPRMSLVLATPATSSISGDSLKWNYTNLKPFQSGSISLTLRTPVVPSLNVNDTLRQLANILPIAGDLTPIDNRDSIYQVVAAVDTVYEKTENHGFHFMQADISAGGYLNYTIRFRNMTANNISDIIMTDTLDVNTDSTSLQMTGSSHNYELTVTDGKKLRWYFKNIQLPTSFDDPTGNTCYISFRVRLKSAVIAGTVIPNKASIQADANAVITNTVQTVVKN